MAIARRKFMLAAAASALAPFALRNPGWAAATINAAKPVEALHAALLEAMRNGEALGFAGRLAKLQPILIQVFDIAGMTRMAIGAAWTALPTAQQASAVDVFGRYMATIYASRFKSYSGQAFDTDKVTERGADKAMVITSLSSPGKDPIALDYLVRDEDGQWRILDVYLNGAISQLAQLRAEFGSPLRDGGFAALQTALEGKIKQLGGGA